MRTGTIERLEARVSELERALAHQDRVALERVRRGREAGDAAAGRGAPPCEEVEALSRVVRRVAHDFNNLLTVIAGRSEILLRRLESGHPLRRQVDIIQETAFRAGELVQELLTFSRGQGPAGAAGGLESAPQVGDQPDPRGRAPEVEGGSRIRRGAEPSQRS